jgi:hypothetical protein
MKVQAATEREELLGIETQATPCIAVLKGNFERESNPKQRNPILAQASAIWFRLILVPAGRYSRTIQAQSRMFNGENACEVQVVRVRAAREAMGAPVGRDAYRRFGGEMA